LLKLLANLVQARAANSKFATQASSRFAFGYGAKYQDDFRGLLPSFFKDRTGRQGVVAVTRLAAISRPVAAALSNPFFGSATTRTLEAGGVEIFLQPSGAFAFVQQFIYWKVNHATSLYRLRSQRKHEPDAFEVLEKQNVC
jgi:hypothetical protein